MVRTDCFAFSETFAGKKVCKCLESLKCFKGNCTFYKTAKQFDDDLIRIHGTDDLGMIGAAYAAGKEKQDEREI